MRSSLQLKCDAIEWGVIMDELEDLEDMIYKMFFLVSFKLDNLNGDSKNKIATWL